MEDNSECVKDERNRKPVFDSRSCPQCGNKVGWKRLNLPAWVGAKWECPVCASLLGFDFGRRIVIAFGAALLASLPFPALFDIEPWYYGCPWIVLVWLYAFTFERIKTVRPGAESDGRPPLRSTI